MAQPHFLALADVILSVFVCIGLVMMSLLSFALVLALILVLPIKWAADFTDGQNTGFFSCAASSVAAPIAAVLLYQAAGSVLLSIVAMVAVHILILRIPLRSLIGFVVIATILQLAVIFALISLGFSLAPAP